MIRLLLVYGLVIAGCEGGIETWSIGGSSMDQPAAVKTDSLGNVYVAGTTLSADFPTTSPPSHPAAQNASKVFVTKFNASGKVEFSVVIGGSGSDMGRALALDGSGNVYVTGWTQSDDFPVTPGALQQRLNLSPTLDRGYYGYDAFVFKLSNDGKLVYSTYLGGVRREFAEAIAVDGDGSAYVTGRTGSYDFPVTPGAFQQTSTIYGLTDDGAFVAKLDPSGSKLVWATYLSGSNYTRPRGIAVGPDLCPVIAGETMSTDFPVRNALQPVAGGATNFATVIGDGFISKLAADGSDLVFSTYLGGAAADSILAAAVDGNNSIYVAGTTASGRFPADVPQHLAGTVLTRLSRSGDVAGAASGLNVSAVLGVAVAPSDPRVVYAGGPEGLFKSVDGGDTWSATALDQISVGTIMVDPRSADVLYAGSRIGGGGNHGGFWKSTDGGQSFARLPVGPDGIFPQNYLAGESWISFLLMDSRDPETLYLVLGSGGIGSGYDQPIYKTTDGGATWASVGSGIKTTLTGLAFDPDDPSTLWAVTPGFYCCGLFGHVTPATLLKSMDGGATFALVSQDGDFPDLMVVNGVFYSGQRKSTDRGGTWTKIPIPGKVAGFDADRLYAVTTQGQLFASTDEGASWNAVTAAAHVACVSVTASADTLYLGSGVWNDAFLTRLDASGALIYTRFLGGSGYDGATSMAVERSGRVIVAGISTSSDFPTVEALAGFASGIDPRAGFGGLLNAFVTEFDESGAITFSTGAGMAMTYSGIGVDVDGTGRIVTAATPAEQHVAVTRIDRTRAPLATGILR